MCVCGGGVYEMSLDNQYITRCEHAPVVDVLEKVLSRPHFLQVCYLYLGESDVAAEHSSSHVEVRPR